VLDDGSTDDCITRLKDVKGIRIISMGEPRGQGITRALGLLANPGMDGYVMIDAHMDIEAGGLERLVSIAIDRGAVVCARSGQLEGRKKFNWVGMTWLPKVEDWTAKPDLAFVYGNNAHGINPIDVTRGACYALTRETFDKLGGYSETFGRFCFFEYDLAVNCKFMGVPLLVDNGTWSYHLYRKKRPYQDPHPYFWQSLAQCFRAKFRPEIFDKYFRPCLERKQRRKYDPMTDYLLNAPFLSDLQQVYQGRKAVTDEEVIQWMNIPEPPGDTVYLDAHVGFDPIGINSGKKSEQNVVIVGARDMHLADGFRNIHSKATIHVVEADPMAIEKLTKMNRSKLTTLHGVALAGADGPVTLYRMTSPSASSLHPMHTVTDKKLDSEVTVPGVCLHTLLQNIKLKTVDLLVLNCEGAEISALEQIAALAGFPDRVRQICVSFHIDHYPVYPVERMNEVLESLNEWYNVRPLRSKVFHYYLLTEKTEA
jgi:FkbM family methyltransferase